MDKTEPTLGFVVDQWREAKKVMAELKEFEANLRQQIIDMVFTAPLAEGTNTTLVQGYTVKAVQKINRTLDPASVQTVIKELHAIGVNTHQIFKYEPELILKGYRGLTPETMAVCDECLVTKPGAVTLEVTDAEVPTDA